MTEAKQARLALLGWGAVALLAAAAIVPLLTTAIPPLTDLPGHLGRFAIQAAPVGSVLRRYFDFGWASLNEGTDLLVEGLRHAMGLVAATWLVAALIPVLTVLGIAAVARRRNPAGAYALGWALVFVHGFAFGYGFLNFSLGMALSLLCFALWLRLETRPWLRLAFVPLSALILVVHAVGGGLMLVLIAGDTLWRLPRGSAPAWICAAVVQLWPLLGAVAMVALWLALSGPGAGGKTNWDIGRKFVALAMAARDQNIVLDVATAVGAAAVLVWGRRLGLAMHAPGALAALTILFLIAPATLSGVEYVDVRLAQPLAMLALALQDWSAAPPRARRVVLWSGFGALAVRLVVTTIAFANYSASYARELEALDHIAEGSRVLALVEVDCGPASWRGPRLDHVANLATLYRGAWVNAHWTIEGVQQMHVRYRPSPDYFDDPSEFVWLDRCIEFDKPFDRRERHSLAETLPRLPYAGIDYLWLIHVGNPTVADPRLTKLWASGSSVLYKVEAVPIGATGP